MPLRTNNCSIPGMFSLIAECKRCFDVDKKTRDHVPNIHVIISGAQVNLCAGSIRQLIALSCQEKKTL